MARSTAESMLISALINSGDPLAAKAYGVTPEKLLGFQQELEWVLDYFKQFGEVPTPEKLRIVFPAFPYDEDERDLRWSAQEIQNEYATRTLMRKVMQANGELVRGDTMKAYETLGLQYSRISERPVNMLTDPGYLDNYISSDEHMLEVPWPTLQTQTGGIGTGELWYYLARQKQGKSFSLMAMACHAVSKGHRVLYYSLEMSRRQMQVRAHSWFGNQLGWGDRIDARAMWHRTYDPITYRKLLGEIAESVPGTLDIHDLSMGFVSPSTIVNRADEYDLVIVDHVGLMRSDSGQRAMDDWRIAAVNSNALKEVVGAKKTRILAAVQINRQGESLSWRPPKLKHAAGTDSIGQDADVAVTMTRFGRMAAVNSIEANRNGEGGKLYFTNFDANRGNFSEISRDAADQIKDDFPMDDEGEI